MAAQTDKDMHFLTISNVKSGIQSDYYGSLDYPPVWRGFMEKTGVWDTKWRKRAMWKKTEKPVLLTPIYLQP